MPLVPKVVDDGIDMNEIEHGVPDEEPEHAQPELVVSKLPGEPRRFSQRIGQPPVASEGKRLAPSEGGLDRVRLRRLQEAMGHLLRERDRQALGRPDVPAGAEDVLEPSLLEVCRRSKPCP